MRLIYRLHRWISTVCAVFFLLLVLTGLPLLFNGDIARWNALEKRPAFGETSSRVLWAEASKGLERIERENPGRRVQSISAYPERGLLVYRFSHTGGIYGVSALAYAPQQDALVPWQSGGVKSPALAAFMGWMHHLHLRLAMGQGGMIFLGVMCFLSFLSILGGVLLYPAFMKRRLFGGMRGGTSAGSFFDWHIFLGILTAVWASLLTLSGIAIVFGMLGYSSYAEDAMASVPQRESAPPAITFAEMIAYAEEHFPAREILYLDAAEGSTPAALTLADAERPQMFRGQDVYLLRTAGGEIESFTKPLPRWLVFCDAVRDLHLHNHSTMFLKIIWAVLDLLCAAVIVTGFCGWLQRSRRKKERPPVLAPHAAAKAVPWKAPAFFVALSLVGMTAPLGDTLTGNIVGSAAWLTFFVGAFVLWRHGKR